MEEKEIDKILKPKMYIVYILVFIYLSIAALCIGYVFSKVYEQRKTPVNSVELVSNDSELEENKSPEIHRAVEFYKAIAMVGVFFIVVAFVHIVPAVMKSRKVLKNQELIEELRIELENLTDNKYQKYHIYLTKNYIIYGINPLKYEDIIWAYIITESKYGIKTGKDLIVYTKDKKRHVVISVGPKDNILDNILIDIQEKNPNIKIGHDKENQKFFENYKK